MLSLRQNYVELLDIPESVSTALAAERKSRNEFRFNGRIRGYKDPSTHTKGVMRKIRKLKMLQAVARQKDYRKEMLKKTLDQDVLDATEGQLWPGNSMSVSM